MNITVPDNLSSLATWYTASMLATLALGVAIGMLVSRSKLRDAAVIAAIVAKYNPEAAAEFGLYVPRPRFRRIRVRVRAVRMRINRARAAIALAVRAAIAPAPTVVTLVGGTPKPEPQPRARDRFTRRPDEFPLLHANPLVPLVTSPKMATQPERRFADRMFLIITRGGSFSSASFLPA